MAGVQHENTPRKEMGMGEMESLLSFYPFAAAQAGDFHSADTLHPTDHPGDVSDISHGIQPLSGGTNSV